MSIPATGWSNSVGTTDDSCSCGTWKDHWINNTNKSWPNDCSLNNCPSNPSLGAHVENSAVSGVRIVPMCDSCNGKNGSFTLRGDVSVPEANKPACN
jgi:hypothetical protein